MGRPHVGPEIVFTVRMTTAVPAPDTRGAVTGTPLVTGEAVEVEARVARIGSRALALLLDIAVQAILAPLLIALCLLTLTALPGNLVDDALVATLTKVLIVVVFVAYPTAVETLT